MIVNLPTSEALNDAALKLYFRAWDGLIEIMNAFDQTYQGRPFGSTQKDNWKEEREQYVEESQEDLQSILSVVQQSNELALKSRIAKVSSYLLLLGGDKPFGAGGKDVEFATLRTLDAVDLPRAVNSLTDMPLSANFVQRYGELRIQRNQYVHLGSGKSILDPVKMCEAMIKQYIDLWPQRAWMCDRVECISLGRKGFFEGKHWSARQEIMFLLDYEKRLIPSAGFKSLFGTKKSALKFVCHNCHDDWAVRRNGPFPSEARTAFYDSETNVMHCILCDQISPAVSKTCADKNCDGIFFSTQSAAVGADQCFRCGS